MEFSFAPGEPADVAERLAHLPFLESQLVLVRQLLEPAAAAALDVHAAGGHTRRRGLLEGRESRLGEAGVRLGDTRPYAVARQAAIHEHDAAVDAGQSLSAQRDVLHVER